MSITVEIDDKDLQKAIKNIKGWEADKRIRIRKVLTETAINIHRKATKFAPVDTGRLHTSIKWEVLKGGRTAIISTNVEYAAYVEFGTKKMRKQPYMRPALLLEQQPYMSKIKAALNARYTIL